MKATLNVNLNGRTGEVDRVKYVSAKTKQLREFGYATLTEQEVDKQIDALLVGKEFGKGLNIIGVFMQDEIVIPKKPS